MVGVQFSKGYDRGKSDGARRGWLVGLEEGKRDGFEEGKKAGFREGKSTERNVTRKTGVVLFCIGSVTARSNPYSVDDQNPIEPEHPRVPPPAYYGSHGYHRTSGQTRAPPQLYSPYGHAHPAFVSNQYQSHPPPQAQPIQPSVPRQPSAFRYTAPEDNPIARAYEQAGYERGRVDGYNEAKAEMEARFQEEIMAAYNRGLYDGRRREQHKQAKLWQESQAAWAQAAEQGRHNYGQHQYSGRDSSGCC
ncbi:hypothetical protein QBC43DRAFT_338072 [Cladorrhinum sp. PSN259]|nr:hypothetical protein QBC43DRAFT_338072 [Cladorrhinum sp. PSN259]